MRRPVVGPVRLPPVRAAPTLTFSEAVVVSAGDLALVGSPDPGYSVPTVIGVSQTHGLWTATFSLSAPSTSTATGSTWPTP